MADALLRGSSVYNLVNSNIFPIAIYLMILNEEGDDGYLGVISHILCRFSEDARLIRYFLDSLPVLTTGPLIPAGSYYEYLLQ